MKCFPFFHKWSYWTIYKAKTLWYRMPLSTYINTTFDDYMERICIRCGKKQKKRVKLTL